MRVLLVFPVFFFGFGVILVAQGPNQSRQVVVMQSDGNQRVIVTPTQQGGERQFDREQWRTAPAQQGDTPQRMPGGGGPPGQGQWQPGGGQPPPWAAQDARPAGRGGPPAAAMQGGQPARPPQPTAGQMNPNQVTQTIARLRAMDTNQNGVLEANEIPANQRDRVNTWVAQLGGNPGSSSFNLASLERRAMTTASGARPDPQQQQQQGGERQQQQRQQPVAPLVPTFGEQATADTPPLGFGQRDRNVQTSPQATRGVAGQRGVTNQNLQQGIVPQPVTVRVSTPYDNVPASLRNSPTFNWFFEFDTGDGRINPATGQEGPPDGQLSMQEYVHGFGGIWTERLAFEFAGNWDELDGNRIWVNGLDRDGDGFATLDEALLTVKERTELQERKSGAAAQQASTPSRQPGRQSGSPTTVSTGGREQANNAMYQGRQSPTATNSQGSPGRVQGGQQMGRGSGGQSPRGSRSGG